MGNGVAVPLAMFCQIFEQQIRVCLDWDRLSEKGCSVGLTVIDRVQLLEGLYAPWYWGPSGGEVDFRDHAAKPIRLLDIPSRLSELYEGRVATITKLADDFRGCTRPPQWSAALYRVAPDAAVMLDGNHRTVAALVAGCNFSILAFTIDGPVDPSVLLDLEHWRRT